ncbi:class I SAM-dependent methyltransferase [Belliella marina]|uniref:Class I SAM-dependent methyltransferase n=1 Tax=Belliella marina TaxID=1644146 RepID=A0ABW4VJW3_9BACT
MNKNCPLCLADNQNFAYNGVFTHCPNCDLVFRNPSPTFLGVNEKKHYQKHVNGPQYPGYVSFLKRAINPISEYLKPNLQALDFGCGPGPAIDFILQDHDISCDNYDPFFFPDGIKSKAYDLIFATECLEHFHNPAKDLENILNLLKPHGKLSVMTDFHAGLEAIPTWYYTKDLTHVSFFSHNTMQWIAKNHGLEIQYSDNTRVCVFEKKTTPCS